MSSAASSSLSPAQLSSSGEASTTTDRASTVSPLPPSTATSISTPHGQLDPAQHGGQVQQHQHQHQHQPPVPHHPAPAGLGTDLAPHPPGPGPGPGASSTIASSSSAAQPLPYAPLQRTLPRPSTQREIDEARAAVVASLGNMLDRELQSRAAALHANDAAIAKQRRDVERATAALRRDNDRLAREADAAARRLKEVGNVQNWAELLEKDFLVLEETLRLARDGGASTSGSSWSGSWRGSRTPSQRGSPEPSRSASRGPAEAKEEALAVVDGVPVAQPGDPGDAHLRRDAEGDVAMSDPAESSPVDKGKGKETGTTSDSAGTGASELKLGSLLQSDTDGSSNKTETIL